MDENSSSDTAAIAAEADNNITEKNLDLAESTCEKILSSINEECIKISQGKENGVEDNEKDMINDEIDFHNTNGEDKTLDQISDECEENEVNGLINATEAKEKDKVFIEDFKESSNDSSEKDGDNGVKIKLRSFASLCSDGSTSKMDSNGSIEDIISSELSAVSVGDIVQHGNIIESDESGMMHLKISNVVGGEDCITGLAIEEEKDEDIPLQIIEQDLLTIESPVDSTKDSENKDDTQTYEVISKESANNDGLHDKTDLNENAENVVNIFKSSLIVDTSCIICLRKHRCIFRIVIRKKMISKTLFICSDVCKIKAELNMFKDMRIQKPRLYFERICGMCGKEVVSPADPTKNQNIFSWQTREFCNKLCLADHIGEITRSCFGCGKYVKVIYMVKYCVRFGPDVRQFCSNPCLENFKLEIKVCSFCQQNLSNLEKVVSQTSNKQYCSLKCLKRAQRWDICQQHYKEVLNCTVCNKSTINKYEYVQNTATVLLCSDTCLKTFKYVSKVKTVNCCLCARLLNAEDSCKYFFHGKQLRVFCSNSCFSVFVISARKIVSCEYCKVKKYNFDMIFSSSVSNDYYTCSMCCLNYAENLCSSGKLGISGNDSAAVNSRSNATSPSTTISTSNTSVIPIVKECSMCSNVRAAQFHMVMSDSSLRSFCSYQCATQFKCIFGFQVSNENMKALEIEDKEISDLISSRRQSEETKDLSNATSAAVYSKGLISMIDVNINSKKFTEPSEICTKLDDKGLTGLMKIFNPPMLCNKSTMCFPQSCDTTTQCDGSLETEDSVMDINVVNTTVNIPTLMKNLHNSSSNPIFIPLPVPIPIFTQSKKNNFVDLESKIKEIFAKFSVSLTQSKEVQVARKEANDEILKLVEREKKLMDDRSLQLINSDTIKAHNLNVIEKETTILKSLDTAETGKVADIINVEKDMEIIEDKLDDSRISGDENSNAEETAGNRILEDNILTCNAELSDEDTEKNILTANAELTDEIVEQNILESNAELADDDIEQNILMTDAELADEDTLLESKVSASLQDTEDSCEITFENEIDMLTKIQTALPKFSEEKTTDDLDEMSGEPQSDSETAEVGKRKRTSEERDCVLPSTKRSKGMEDIVNLEYGIAVWKAWVKRKLTKNPTMDLHEDLMGMECDVLNNNLTLFLQDLKSHSCSIDVDTIFYLLLGNYCTKR